MKYLKPIAIYCYVLFAASLHSAAQMIKWDSERPLRWENFQNKKRPCPKRFSATTYSSIQYKLIVCSSDTFSACIYTTFNPYMSWKKHGRLSLYLLRHEQSHFDISEWYARRARESFSKYRGKHPHGKETKDMFSYILTLERRRCRRCQKKYDRQTRHSKRKDMQAWWNEKISAEIYNLRAFADTTK